MISVLIPTYNHVCVELVKELSRQMTDGNIDGEILVIDDCSTDDAVQSVNKQITDIRHARLIQLQNNVGISKIRNLLVENAKYDILICVDSDTFPKSKSFIADYLKAIADAEVVCGGLTYRHSKEISALRYKYGSLREEETLEVRSKRPYKSFKTSNYCIRRGVFETVHFDESIDKYGNEDTLFGKDLEQKRIPICHIDNPVYHDDLDSDIDFLIKTYTGIDNLVQHQEKLHSHSKLLRFYAKLKIFRVAFIFRISYVLFGGIMERHVISGKPSVKIFQLLKICYLCYQMVHLRKSHK